MSFSRGGSPNPNAKLVDLAITLPKRTIEQGDSPFSPKDHGRTPPYMRPRSPVAPLPEEPKSICSCFDGCFQGISSFFSPPAPPKPESKPELSLLKHPEEQKDVPYYRGM